MLPKLIQNIFGLRKHIQQFPSCPVCGDTRGIFLPLPEAYRANAVKYGFNYLDKIELLSIETYSCANCGSSDRERLYALWIEQKIEERFFTIGSRAIHFAPEPALSRKLKELNFFDYLTADLLMEHVDYKLDIMDTHLDDNSFSFFICSHVLEHVENDDQAIKELYRITEPGGCGILMVPIVLGLAKTAEDQSVINEDDRWRLYGQNDHVRLYAHDDYVNKIRYHGFRVEEFGADYFGEQVFRTLGLALTSVLYVVSK